MGEDQKVREIRTTFDETTYMFEEVGILFRLAGIFVSMSISCQTLSNKRSAGVERSRNL